MLSKLLFKLSIILVLAYFTINTAYAKHSFSPIVESTIGGGYDFIDSTNLDKNVKNRLFSFPYGKVHLRFNNNKMLSPEIILENSGYINFDKGGIKSYSKHIGYNSYYVKIPTGIPFPFFKYWSYIFIDTKYSTMSNNITISKPLIINNIIHESGKKFNIVSSDIISRIYLPTPIVSKPSIFEYSYAGFFYMDSIKPRSVSRATDQLPDNKAIVESSAKSGGVFYDMRKDTPLKGLNFGIAVYLGYADVYIKDDVTIVNLPIGNKKALANIYSQGLVSYRYKFNNNTGLELSFSIEYNYLGDLLGESDKNKYLINLGSEVKYRFLLNFIFNY